MLTEFKQNIKSLTARVTATLNGFPMRGLSHHFHTSLQTSPLNRCLVESVINQFYHIFFLYINYIFIGKLSLKPRYIFFYIDNYGLR